MKAQFRTKSKQNKVDKSVIKNGAESAALYICYFGRSNYRFL